MEKKVFLLTTLFALSSSIPAMASNVTDVSHTIPNFSNHFLDSQSDKKVLKDLKGKKEMFQKMIEAPAYQNLPLEKKIELLNNYFSVRTDIFKEYQKIVLSSTDSVELQGFKNFLIDESDKENRDNALISSLVEELRATDMSKWKPEEIQGMKDRLKNLITSYKNLRDSGRSLDTLISAQMKVMSASQLTLLNKMGQQYDLNGDKKEALELNQKALKLTEGDMEFYQKVANILKAEQKSFFFVDNEPIELSVPLLMKKEGSYMDIWDISKVPGFEVVNNQDNIIIKNRDNILEINKKDLVITFNGIPIGKNFTLLSNNKLYVPIRSLFELFHYNVEWNRDVQSILVHKAIYEENEIDNLTPDEVVTVIFQ